MSTTGPAAATLAPQALILPVIGMSCAACATRVERALRQREQSIRVEQQRLRWPILDAFAAPTEALIKNYQAALTAAKTAMLVVQ